MKISFASGICRRMLSVLLTAGIGCSLLVSCSQDLPKGTDTTSGVTESVVVTEAGTTEAPEIETPDYTVLENPALTIYVDGSVETTGDGSEAAPYKTIYEANEHIQGLRAASALPDGGIKVLVQPGEYYMPDGLNLGGDGYGTEACPIVYESVEERGAVLTAGTYLNPADFVPLNEEEKARIIDKEAAENIVKLDLTTYGMTVEDWGELYAFGTYNFGSRYENGSGPAEAQFYCNGERMVLARYPNDGWSLISDVTSTGAPLDSTDENPEGPTFVVSDDVTERLKQWQTLEDVWTFGYFMYDWADASNPVVATNSSCRRITLGHMVFYGIRGNQRYYFFNVFEELDMEGEYYLDRDNGILYFYPPADFASSDIVMTDSPNSLVGGGLTYVTFRGFTICGTRGNGMNLSGDHVTVDNCYIYGIRGIGLNINGTNMTVKNSEITSIGGMAIRLVGGDNTTLTKSGNLIYNNYIHDWSQVVRTSQDGVMIEGCGNTVSHNEICDAPHEAIKWNGAYNIIEYNNIHNVCTETSDCGAVYAGRNFTSYGTEIRYNYIHDIGADADDVMRPYWDSIGGQLAIGLYWDDGISGQIAYGNVIENAAAFGVMVGGGRDNALYNNIIINPGKEAIYYDSRVHDGEFDGGWYGNMASRGTQFTDLQSICSSDAWSAAFPKLSTLLINSADVDRNDPLLACNPADSYVANNIVYKTLENEIEPFNFAEVLMSLSQVTDNYVITDLADFPGYESGDLTMTENAAVYGLIPSFEAIPFAEIGRIQ